MRVIATLQMSQQLLPWLLETAAVTHNYQKVGFVCFTAWGNIYWSYSSPFAAFWNKPPFDLESSRASKGRSRHWQSLLGQFPHCDEQHHPGQQTAQASLQAALEEAWGLVVVQEVRRWVVHELVQQRLCPHHFPCYFFQSHVGSHITFLTAWSKSCQVARRGERKKILPATLMTLKAGSWPFFSFFW